MNRGIRRVVAPVTFGAAIVLALGCTQPPVSTSVVVMLDTSSSIPGSTVDFYAAATAAQVLRQLGPADQLTVLPIDAKSEPRSEAIYSLDLSQRQFNKNVGFARRTERINARVLAYVSEQEPNLQEAIRAAVARRATFAGGTDLIGALHGAAAAFPANPQRRRLLVIFSDMVQDTDELDLSTLARDGEAGIAPIIDRLAGSRRLPVLSGVTVIVVGAGENGPGEGNDARFFRCLRQFWQAFFSRCGARIDAERDYGYRTQERIPIALHQPRAQ